MKNNKLIKEIIEAEFKETNEQRAARKLYALNITSEEINKLEINDIYKINVGNALRNLERKNA